jgi:hypothetical protein
MSCPPLSPRFSTFCFVTAAPARTPNRLIGIMIIRQMRRDEKPIIEGRPELAISQPLRAKLTTHWRSTPTPPKVPPPWSCAAYGRPRTLGTAKEHTVLAK